MRDLLSLRQGKAITSRCFRPSVAHQAAGGGLPREPGSMLVELGHFALVLALLVALVQGVLPLAGASVRSRPLMDVARPAALLQFGLVALAFAVFMHAHI